MPTKKAAMFVEDTEVSSQKSIGEILALLVRAGATSVNQELEGGRVTGLSFVIPVAGGRIPYRLPARVEPVFAKINGRREKWGKWSQSVMADRDREQAERVAWRQLYWWLKSQLALIDLGMVQAAEVLWSYMLDPSGKTFFEVHGPKLLAGPKIEEVSR